MLKLRRLAATIVPAIALGAILTPQAEAQPLLAVRVCTIQDVEYYYGGGLSLGAAFYDNATISWDASCLRVNTDDIIPTTIQFDDNVRQGFFTGSCVLGSFTGQGGSTGFNGTIIGSSVGVFTSSNNYVLVTVAVPETTIPCSNETRSSSIVNPAGVQVVWAV